MGSLFVGGRGLGGANLFRRPKWGKNFSGVQEGGNNFFFIFGTISRFLLGGKGGSRFFRVKIFSHTLVDQKVEKGLEFFF